MANLPVMSMTAFAQHTADFSWGQLTWELKSVNHRFLELYIHMPDRLSFFEMDLRSKIKGSIPRGKVNASLKLQFTEAASAELSINKSLIDQLSPLVADMSDRFPQAQLNVFDLLNYRGVVVAEQADITEYCTVLLSELEQCITQFLQAREREGAGIVDFFNNTLNDIEQSCHVIATQLPNVLLETRQKILEKFAEVKSEMDEDRLEQEMVWYAQKLDLAEELQRLKSHVDEFKRVISKGGVIGRRLDFLTQELNREANTIASKSSDVAITQAAVDIKVAIEQIKEQVQNIE